MEKENLYLTLEEKKRQLLSLLLKEQEVGIRKKAIERQPRTSNRFPLSYHQQQLFFLQELDPNKSVYNETLTFEIEGNLVISLLQESLQQIVNRHEVLRTSFVSENGQVNQYVHENVDVEVHVKDLSGYGPNETEEWVESILNRDATKPFDLSKPPLIRGTVLKIYHLKYILQITIHHIVCDAWSNGLLMKELGMIYDSKISEEENPLQPLTIQYADFSVWQRKWLEGKEKERQLSYWTKQLQGAAPLLEVPTDKIRPPIQSYHGSAHSKKISSKVTKSLKELCRKEGVTLFMILLAAFKILFARYSNQTDILVGTPVSNRNKQELESLIGYFANTLVIRTDLSGVRSFRELLQIVRQVSIEAFDHQELPFDQVVEALNPQRNLSYNPIFQVMFVMNSVSLSSKDFFQHFKLTPKEKKRVYSKFDLTLSAEETEQEIEMTLEYNSDLFQYETIERMLGQFEILIEAIAENPNLDIFKLPLLSEDEKEKIIGHKKWTQRFPVDKCLHELFEEQAKCRPHEIAVVYEGESLTYSELNKRANQLAHHLRKRGCCSETLVGIYLERSLEMIISILGVLKAGGAYVPLDTSWPQERVDFLLHDTGMKLVITEERLKYQAPGMVELVLLDIAKDDLNGEDETNPENLNAPSNAVYIIYTSGSTGVPKGVIVEHRNVVRLFEGTKEWFHFHEKDVWTLFHSYAFDFSVWEIWGALLYGGKLVIVPYWVSRSPDQFLNLLCKEKVTVLNQTPSAFQQLIFADQSHPLPYKLDLRFVIFGGEKLELQSLRPWIEKYGDQSPRLVNMYGITETTVHVTFRPITKKDVDATTKSLIGVAIPDMCLYILDQYLQPVPLGVPGEIFVGGAGVARGYLNRPELNAERFIVNPFSVDRHERLYKTGDIARYVADGELEYLSRIDDQVKVRGFRIELGEIKAALFDHPSVKDCAVIFKVDSQGNQGVVAYIVPVMEGAVTIDALRDYLKERLPGYMVPFAFVMLEALPLTNNGKLDRNALPAPSLTSEQTGDPIQFPHTEVESKLLQIWKQILGIENIRVTDNFFHLGGDSIRSIRITSLAKEHGIQLTIQDLFKYQTIKDLAKHIKTCKSEQKIEAIHTEPFSLIAEEERVRLPDFVEDAYPLTKLQLGMLFHSESFPEQILYRDIISLQIEGIYNHKAFQEAVDQLLAYHPVLRTSLDMIRFSQPLQLVHKNVDLQVQLEDVRYHSVQEQEDILKEKFQKMRARQFMLNCAPLLRMCVFLRTERTFQLMIQFHHTILDGWSLATMVTELLRRYSAILQNTAKEDIPLKTLFRDFVALEMNCLKEDEPRTYWQEKLHDFQEGMNTLLSPNTHDSIEKCVFPVAIPEDTSERLIQLADSAGVTLKSVLLSAHLKVLSMITGQRDVITGVVSNNRLEGTDGDRVLGLFLNTLPFRSKLDGGTWRELITKTFEDEKEMLPFRRYPLAQIIHNLGGHQLFETSFNYTHFHIYRDTMDNSPLRILAADYYQANSYALTAQFGKDPYSKRLHLELEYRSDIALQIDSIAGIYATVLQEMVSNPEHSYWKMVEF